MKERKSNQITIRLYKPGDLETCRELWVELTEWHRQIYDSPGIGGADPGKQFDEHLPLTHILSFSSQEFSIT